MTPLGWSAALAGTIALLSGIAFIWWDVGRIQNGAPSVSYWMLATALEYRWFALLVTGSLCLIAGLAVGLAAGHFFLPQERP